MSRSAKTTYKKAPLTYFLAAGLTAVMLLMPTMATAQPKTLFDLLFGDKKAAPSEPSKQRKSAPQRQVSPKKSEPATPRKTSGGQVPIPTPVPKQLVLKLENASNVLVLGDFLSSGLASGLTEAFSDNPSVRITDLSKGSSGFVRQDYYNWNQDVTALLQEEKPAAVVMMIGANDRQPIALNGKSLSAQSDEWTVQYRIRIEQFIKTVKTAGYPLIWVGQLPFTSRTMSKDMLTLNEIYRSVAEKSETDFVDIWDGFASEDGHAVITGLDINGQDAQLRSSDGIGLTGAGKRKLAFYVEKPLRKILNQTEQHGEPAASAFNESGTATSSHIDRISAVSLRDYGADKSGILLGASPAPKRPKTARQNNLYSPYPDRADYFLSVTNK